ncbi:hypothetical protein [Natronospira bacteriovora]|uniref:DUF3426 domain-containing protein n=1 Tax=Natronospira bacteriovora TaxID=3069753 RepID=A0ABU0W3B1_9GAMM|nr:hypothetical protein [Natronospira sp. AB-CW4]MDQ2068502.1 hypothetical protein [Natronospira sp. AB-CW4]
MKAIAIPFTILAALLLSTTSWAACSSSDFDIEGLEISVDNCSGRNCPRLVIRGELVNHCSAPAGARVEIEALDDSGRKVDSVDGWPARTANIEAGGRAEFDFTAMMRFRRNMSDFAVSIVESRNW